MPKVKAKAYRHGEITFVETKKLPEDLQESKTNVFGVGSHGNNHSFEGGRLYLLEKPEEYLIGYFAAEGTKLYHPEHSPQGEAELPDGAYEVRKQHEHTPEGLVPVID